MAKSLIPYGRHHIDEDDIAAVVDVLQHQFLTQGSKVPEFEHALCEYTQARFATAVNSATSGLHVACLALGVGPGDWVWTSPNSFVASANCALYCGADVDFVDIDPFTRNMCVKSLEQKLLQAERLGTLPKALVVVHFSGASCEMSAIAKLAEQYNVSIIEDAAHALGGQYQERNIGCCQYSALSVLSFHPVKSMTTAEGGAVLTNDAALDKQVKLIAKHGVTRDAELMEGPSEGPWYYQQIVLGYNYRLSDLHAALGVTQLKKLDKFVSKRRELVAKYFEELGDLPLKLPDRKVLNQSAWHLFMVELNQHNRADVFAALQQKGIGVNVHYIPIHLQPFYRHRGFSVGDFPYAEAFYQKALTLPLFPDLSADEQDTVIQALKEVLS